MHLLSDAQYSRFQSLIRSRTGLYFPREKRPALSAALSAGLTSVDSGKALYNLLAATPTTDREWRRLITALTVGETCFFRERRFFERLRTTILPMLIQAQTGMGRRLRIWCAGCSTGEEAYSIAFILQELIAEFEGCSVQVLATDINLDALETAAEGRYQSSAMRGVGEEWREHYFDKSGDWWSVPERTRELVTFGYHNLIDLDCYPINANCASDINLILCRNVLIYFSPEDQAKIISALAEHLMFQGWLALGPSDPRLVTHPAFDQIESEVPIFQKKNSGP